MKEIKQKPAGGKPKTADAARVPKAVVKAAWLQAREAARAGEKFMREKLRKERKAQNMSQLTLSAEADLACNTICRIEKGTAEPGIGNLLRLTDALHIPMSELFPQGEGPKAKEIGIIDDAQLQEIISLWHKIPGKARGSAYVMIKGMLIAAQQLPQK